MKYNFSTMSTDHEPNEKNFTEVSENTYICSEPIKVNLDREIELYLFIEGIDKTYTDDIHNIISIGVIPSFNSLSKKGQQSILEQYDNEDVEKIDDLQILYDILSYGYRVTLHEETVLDEQFMYKLNSAKAVYPVISGLIGFELDKRINAIGNTGWDFLDDYCNDRDLLQLALNKVQ